MSIGDPSVKYPFETFDFPKTTDKVREYLDEMLENEKKMKKKKKLQHKKK
jgi:hypothetical protein